jgi:PPOX class probable F420-dependent enzyme
MADDLLSDPTTPFGERVRRRLSEDLVIWLTTVGSDLTPQPNPVWFLLESDGLLVYNRSTAHRLRHVRARPRVSLNLDSDGRGGDIVVMTGSGEVSDGDPAPHEHAAYVAKYGAMMTRVSGTLEKFSRQYPVPLRVRGLRVRGW